MPFHVFLVFALLLCNVLLRTFTNGFHVLPKILNVVDIPIVVILFLISLSLRDLAGAPAWTRTISRRSVGFLFVLFFGCVLNLGYFFLPAALGQTAMLMLPLLLFIALVRLPFTPENVASYSRVLKRLIIFEVALGVLQFPIRLKTGDSEAVHGTFTGNAEQYGAFLMIAVFYFIGLAVLHPEKRRRYVIATIVIFLLNLSVDNKASWLGAIVALGIVLWSLEIVRGGSLRIFAPIAAIGAIALAITFMATLISGTSHKYAALFQVIKSGEIHRLGKVKSYWDIARSHTRNPHMLLVGAGPSNLYSRSARQFYFRGLSDRMYVNPETLVVGEGDAVRPSDSMGRWLTPTTQKAYYLQFYDNREMIIPIGSAQVDGVFSTYAGLLGETGILGTWLYLTVYFLVLRKLLGWLRLFRTDALIFPLLVSTAGFMTYLMVNSVYGPLLETTRLTTLLWSMAALVAIYVRSAERRAAETEVWLDRETAPDTEPAHQPGWA